MSKLVVEHVSKSFDGVPILEDVSLRLEEGELVCLLGVSGAGKTTLFNIISGLMEPEEGKVYLSGEEITGKAGKISYMLQKRPSPPLPDGAGQCGPAPPHPRGEKRGAYAEAAATLGNSAWRGRNTGTPASSPAGCGSGPPSFEPISFPRTWPFWTSRSAPWTPSPKGPSTPGIWR